MLDSKPLLFQKDFKKFMEILTIDDAEKRLDAFKANFDDVILCEIIRYGMINDAWNRYYSNVSSFRTGKFGGDSCLGPANCTLVQRSCIDR
jgi:hypothetical protein